MATEDNTHDSGCIETRSQLLDAVDKVSSQLTSASAILNSLFWHHADLTDTPPLNQKDIATLLSTARDLVLEAHHDVQDLCGSEKRP